MSRLITPVLLAITGLGFNIFSVTQDIAPKLFTATVEISVKEKKEDSFSHAGTGWLYENQTIVTAKHVVDGYDTVVKKPNGKEESKQVPYSSIQITFNDGQKIIIDSLKESKKYDVALMTFDKKKLKGTKEPLVFATSRPKVGENLFGAGFPYDYECLLLAGYVTGWHVENKGELAGEYLVTNAMFAPGNSGGPVVNTKGDVIGMVDWIDRRSAQFSFALPADVIQKAISEINSN